MNHPLQNHKGVGLPGPSGRYGLGPVKRGEPQQSQAAQPPKQPDKAVPPKQSS